MRMPAAPPAPTHDAPPRGARGRGAESETKLRATAKSENRGDGLTTHK